METKKLSRRSLSIEKGEEQVSLRKIEGIDVCVCACVTERGGERENTSRVGRPGVIGYLDVKHDIPLCKIYRFYMYFVSKELFK